MKLKSTGGKKAVVEMARVQGESVEDDEDLVAVEAIGVGPKHEEHH